jgi:glucose dehydrogenase
VGGTLTTAGGLLFTGTSDGYVKAFDAKTGKELWKFQTGSGVVSVPITWEMDGEQYVGYPPATAARCRCGAATWPN